MRVAPSPQSCMTLNPGRWLLLSDGVRIRSASRCGTGRPRPSGPAVLGSLPLVLPASTGLATVDLIGAALLEQLAAAPVAAFRQTLGVEIVRQIFRCLVQDIFVSITVHRRSWPPDTEAVRCRRRLWQRRLRGREERRFASGCDPEPRSGFGEVVPARMVLYTAVVPDGNRVGFPGEADLEPDPVGDVIVEEVE